MMEVDYQATAAVEEAAHLPFVEKYRPDSLEEIISHSEIV
jgi:hypothetical protein